MFKLCARLRTASGLSDHHQPRAGAAYSRESHMGQRRKFASGAGPKIRLAAAAANQRLTMPAPHCRGWTKWERLKGRHRPRRTPGSRMAAVPATPGCRASESPLLWRSRPMAPSGPPRPSTCRNSSTPGSSISKRRDRSAPSPSPSPTTRRSIFICSLWPRLCSRSCTRSASSRAFRSSVLCGWPGARIESSRRPALRRGRARPL